MSDVGTATLIVTMPDGTHRPVEYARIAGLERLGPGGDFGRTVLRGGAVGVGAGLAAGMA